MFYYGIDLTEVIKGNGPAPSLVLALIWRLPDTSLTAALAQGGREYFGWGVDRHLRADIYDAQNMTTRAAGNWAKKPPEIAPWPRPGVKKTSDGPKTVKDLYAQMQQPRRK